MIFDRPVTPRATRTADIAASVPDETNRTFSIDGTAAATVSAISISRTVGAPKLEPRSRALDHGRSHLGMHVAQDHRAPRADVVDVLVAVDVEQIGTRGAGHERRLAADRAEGSRGTVDAARDHAVGPHESLVAGRKAEVGFGAGRGIHCRCLCTVSFINPLLVVDQASATNPSQLLASRMRLLKCSSLPRSAIASTLESRQQADPGPERYYTFRFRQRD